MFIHLPRHGTQDVDTDFIKRKEKRTKRLNNHLIWASGFETVSNRDTAYEMDQREDFPGCSGWRFAGAEVPAMSSVLCSLGTFSVQEAPFEYYYFNPIAVSWLFKIIAFLTLYNTLRNCCGGEIPIFLTKWRRLWKWKQTVPTFNDKIIKLYYRSKCRPYKYF